MMAERIIIFVEGETEEVLFPKIIDVYKNSNPECKKYKCDIINIKGIGNYKNVAKRKLKNKQEDAIRNNDTIKNVICCYDNDVFEFSQNPPIDWKKVKPELETIIGEGKIKLINIKNDIEDWLLTDIDGLCKYLNTRKKPKKLTGGSGYQKINNWFKTFGKVYFKGYDSEKIIKHLNIDLICKKHSKELKPIRIALGIKD
jgi:hypothetical protein